MNFTQVAIHGRGELLRGPSYYVAILAAVTLTYWRESAVGLLVIALMCGGDGLADIVGRRFGSVKLPHNGNKSWAGSAAMFLGALLGEGISAPPQPLDQSAPGPFPWLCYAMRFVGSDVFCRRPH